MVWVIWMHCLTAGHLYHLLNESQEHLFLLPHGSFGSFCFARVPASLGPSPPFLWFCFSILASQGQLFVLLGTRLLWVPPHPLCDFDFLPGLLWDSFGFLRVRASLGPSALLRAFVLYCPGFSGAAFSRSCLIRVSSPFFSRCMVCAISMHRLTAWH